MCEAGYTSVTVPPSSGRLLIRPTPGLPKVRKVWRLVLAGTPRVLVHNNNLHNLVRGLEERVFLVPTGTGFAPPPAPVRGAFGRLAAFRGKLLAMTGRTTPITPDEFVGLYEGRKRSLYQSALESLQVVPVSHRDAVVKTFVKAEKVIPTTSKPDPAPRVIQPRSTRYNLEVGLYLKTLEARICKGIKRVYNQRDGDGRIPVVMKGLTPSGVGRSLRRMWDTFVDPVAVGLDASRFDQHVSRDALQWEHSVYRGLYPGDRRLARLLSMQLNTTGVAYCADGHVKYRVEGRRMSGDMNTGMGNCLLMCAMVYAYAAHVGVELKLANNGDDCVVFMERADLERFRGPLNQWFLEMGFTMKVEDPVTVFSRVEFCRGRPVHDGTEWVMVRNPQEAIARDLVSLLDMGQGFRAWAHAVGVGGMAIAGGVPLFHALYTRLKALGRPSSIQNDVWYSDSGFARWAKIGTRSGKTVTTEARVSFWEAFGITPDEQLAIEAELSRLTPQG